jgi:hypothetical protein
MSLNVQTLDSKIWRKDLVTEYLLNCYQTNSDAVIDFGYEGSCAESLGMYRLLDDFCLRTGYPKEKITIVTANMLEEHSEYKIIRQSDYWYEIEEINHWLTNKTIYCGKTPNKHFANFTSRSNWARLWIATLLRKNYSDKTLQTYHYDPLKENYNLNGYIGLDDLVKHKCDLIVDAAKFITECPYTLDITYLSNLDNCKDSKFQHENSYYPIQHPSNLNLLQYYNDIFVDIVVEPNVSGNCLLITEKLWRCIIAKRPFIVMSNPDYLINLKRLGFKTFDHWWLEDYDGWGGKNRILKIAEILDVIAGWSTDELHNKLVQMDLILKYNYNIFLRLTSEKVNEVFNT